MLLESLFTKFNSTCIMKHKLENSLKLQLQLKFESKSHQSIKAKMKQTKMNMKICSPIVLMLFLLLLLSFNCLICCAQSASNNNAATTMNFPGVSRELASFCAARPSLQIDLAAMIVHVKRNVSFNYKLYLFSVDNVFQTGQVIPRDDFRIHSFPVKFKKLNEFWPSNVNTYEYDKSSLNSFKQVSSDLFELKQFMKSVPLNPYSSSSTIDFQPLSGLLSRNRKKSRRSRKSSTASANNGTHRTLPADAISHALPGDESFSSQSGEEENFNKHIQFDRDDQVASVSRRAVYLGEEDDYLAEKSASKEPTLLPESAQRTKARETPLASDLIVPVGSFSSFNVNVSYLVRKDFDQTNGKLIKIELDAQEFVVKKVFLLNEANNGAPFSQQNGDFDFLNHKLLRDPDTRIISINQIYEDWITRNFYTIVYIQRKINKHLMADTSHDNDAELLEEDNSANKSRKPEEPLIVNDRLIFRGTSIALLGADQLDYVVKAAAFVTEKNGLHYYLEFLNTGKFYVCAVDWTKRPFRIIDSIKFPIKATKTLMDNEELLLCPPAVCYSNAPLDEIVSYGRLALSRKVQREASILSTSFSNLPVAAKHSIKLTIQANSNNSSLAGNFSKPLLANMNETSLTLTSLASDSNNRLNSSPLTKSQLASAGNDREGRELRSGAEEADNDISLDSVIEEVKLASKQLQTRLHLRDWVWTLARHQRQQQQQRPLDNELGKLSFDWRYELARRNDVKVKQDTYGYILIGHEIDASYRIYNELYLISSNQLITINYTMPNETAISTHPIGDEFFGLSSTLIDPITAAFYDRYTNEIYFFKGDRYIGYDYATKKPLDDFILQPTSSSEIIMAESIIPGQDSNDQSSAKGDGLLVSSLPVIGILGRQHQVDGIHHDLATDQVFIFSAMKFYTFEASEFKNGSFHTREPSDNSEGPLDRQLPQMHCINTHFLRGCNFDEAYLNPCQDDEIAPIKHEKDSVETTTNFQSKTNDSSKSNKLTFNEEQQMKLRNIAMKNGLLNFLMENSLLNFEPTKSMLNSSGEYQPQEKVVFYLLIAMVVLTIILIVIVIVVLVNWTRMRMAENNNKEKLGQQSSSLKNHYLSNQQQRGSRTRHHHHHNRADRTSIISSRNTLTDRTLAGKPLVSPVGVIVPKSSRRISGAFDNSAL